ncbi:MAG TPA: nitrilase-related carbon-nitrogen hydrolase, partial [Actinomycetota bacterium]|nr:nitrilase-related carbon-nitrogen hydrolase [Actinomycetota bacterium]
RLWANSVDVPGPHTDRFIKACAEHNIYCVLGVNERESVRPGSLYNTMMLLGPEGLLWKHRKLMPTMHERLFHGVGTGRDLNAIETSVGKVGGLICWENRMPLARYELYRQGVQIWTAPTADDSDGWIATMSHIAIEAGAFVVSAPQYIPRSAFPDDFPIRLPDDGQAIGRGGAAIFEPLQGRAIAGPLYDQEGTVVADVDLGRTMTAKRWFDVVGHYGREDVLFPEGASAESERES